MDSGYHCYVGYTPVRYTCLFISIGVHVARCLHARNFYTHMEYFTTTGQAFIEAIFSRLSVSDCINKKR